jgi:hypothetical protein
MNQPPPWQPPSGQQPNSQPLWSQQSPTPYNPPQYGQPRPGQFQPPPSNRSQLQRQRGGLWQWYKRQARGAKIGLGCGVLIVLLVLCSCVGAAFGARNSSVTPSASTPPSGQITGASPTATTASDLTPAFSPTVVSPPTATATAKPTPTSTPTSTPTPTPTPCPGVNCNPWGYNFSPGNLIYHPPSTFCSYFTCVSTFWTATSGYVVECYNGHYSHSGGVSGACSHNSGVWRPLYSH